MQLYLIIIENATIIVAMMNTKNKHDKSTSSTSTWALFLTTHAILIDKIEQTLKKTGLPSLQWYDVLWTLERAPQHRLRMHELADLTVLSRSNLTRLIDRLKTVKLVERHGSSEDRRGAYAFLTPAGKMMREKMWPVYQACIIELFNQHFSAEELTTIDKTFRKVLSAVKK